MAFTIRAYPELKSEFDKQIIALRGHHGAADIEALPKERRRQVKTVLAIIEALDEASLSSAPRGNEKELALCGAMLILMDEIRSSYTVSSPENSFLFNIFGSVIGLSEENQLDSFTEAAMLKAAQRLFTGLVYEEGKPDKPIRKEHAFSTIKDFDIKGFWKRGNSMIKSASDALIDEAEKARKDTDKAAFAAANPAKKGWLSSFFSSSSGSASTSTSSSADASAEHASVP